MKTVQASLKLGSLTASLPEGVSRTEAAGRLVVVVPDVAEAALLAGRIHLVAQARNQDVLLIGVASQSLSAAELRRRLTLLAAFLQHAGAKVQVRVEEGLNWMPELRALLSDNDLLACCVVESPPAVGERWLELLANRFQRPVYAFMDTGTLDMPERGLPARLAPWLGSIAIILAFFWLQVRLSQQGDAAAYSGWLVLSIPVEIGMIWLLNALLG